MSANDLTIDDRDSRTLKANLGTEWRLITDKVMGGESQGDLTLFEFEDRHCVRVQGDVSTKNNGGFVQMSLPFPDEKNPKANDFDGVEIEVSGNNERYNIHLRTSSLWLPWQSYRFTFKATSQWQVLRFPFSQIEKYKVNRDFELDKITRIGLVAIGREFRADLCVAAVRFYRS